MGEQICDVCGKLFVWKKGHAYCSYDCQEKARKKREQQALEYLEKIKKETKCPACGGIGVDIERFCNDDHGFYWETLYKCKKCGRKAKDSHWYLYKAPTLFDQITASPEVLAEKLVYRYDGNGTWRSFLLYGYEFLTKEEAIAATVAKLKELENEH